MRGKHVQGQPELSGVLDAAMRPRNLACSVSARSRLHMPGLRAARRSRQLHLDFRVQFHVQGRLLLQQHNVRALHDRALPARPLSHRVSGHRRLHVRSMRNRLL